MKSTLFRYRVMANIVGVLLIILILVGVPMKYLGADGSTTAEIGGNITTYLGVAHGWLYMIFLITAAMLARAAKWSISFTITTLLAGTVPVVSFWAEHRATKSIRNP